MVVGGGVVVVWLVGLWWLGLLVVGGAWWLWVVVLGLLVVIASKGRERERERETYMNNKKEYLNKVVKFFFLNY